MRWLRHVDEGYNTVLPPFPLRTALVTCTSWVLATTSGRGATVCWRMPHSTSTMTPTPRRQLVCYHSLSRKLWMWYLLFFVCVPVIFFRIYFMAYGICLYCTELMTGTAHTLSWSLYTRLIIPLPCHPSSFTSDYTNLVIFLIPLTNRRGAAAGISRPEHQYRRQEARLWTPSTRATFQTLLLFHWDWQWQEEVRK